MFFRCMRKTVNCATLTGTAALAAFLATAGVPVQASRHHHRSDSSSHSQRHHDVTASTGSSSHRHHHHSTDDDQQASDTELSRHHHHHHTDGDEQIVSDVSSHHHHHHHSDSDGDRQTASDLTTRHYRRHHSDSDDQQTASDASTRHHHRHHRDVNDVAAEPTTLHHRHHSDEETASGDTPSTRHHRRHHEEDDSQAVAANLSRHHFHHHISADNQVAIHSSHDSRLARIARAAAAAKLMHNPRWLAHVARYEAHMNNLDRHHQLRTLEIEAHQQNVREATRALHSGNVVRAAEAFRGTPYVMGGTSRSGFDCSGFTRYIFGESAGVDLPRTAEEQYYSGQPIDKEDLRAGDLVFFRDTYRRGISHVGMYIGDGRFVHACNPSKGVTISSLSEQYYINHWAGARRVIHTRMTSDE
jgi:hypothetical protein